MNFNVTKTGQWYRIVWSKMGSPVPESNTVFGLLTKIRSIMEDEYSV